MKRDALMASFEVQSSQSVWDFMLGVSVFGRKIGLRLPLDRISAENAYTAIVMLDSIGIADGAAVSPGVKLAILLSMRK